MDDPSSSSAVNYLTTHVSLPDEPQFSEVYGLTAAVSGSGGAEGTAGDVSNDDVVKIAARLETSPEVDTSPSRVSADLGLRTSDRSCLRHDGCAGATARAEVHSACVRCGGVDQPWRAGRQEPSRNEGLAQNGASCCAESTRQTCAEALQEQAGCLALARRAFSAGAADAAADQCDDSVAAERSRAVYPELRNDRSLWPFVWLQLCASRGATVAAGWVLGRRALSATG